MIKKKADSNNETEIDMTQDDAYNDDVVFEEEDTGTGKIKKLQEKLTACNKERVEYLDGWQRAKADFANAQKGLENQKQEYVSYANQNLLEEFLPVVDSFDMAIANKEVWESVDENWRVGVEYIYSQLLSILENNGVKQLDPVGDTFDPAIHTSVEQVDAQSESEDHVIARVIQKGYIMKDKVLRSPKVVVKIFNQV
jgi:molecular chaperone GrpE